MLEIEHYHAQAWAMFPKVQVMAQDRVIISQAHRTGSEENPLSPTPASLELETQDSMPSPQEQRLHYLGAGRRYAARLDPCHAVPETQRPHTLPDAPAPPNAACASQ